MVNILVTTNMQATIKELNILVTMNIQATIKELLFPFNGKVNTSITIEELLEKCFLLVPTQGDRTRITGQVELELREVAVGGD